MPPNRPIPRLRGEERLYFEQAKAGRLVYQQCADCDRKIFYPRTVCPGCLSDHLDQRFSAGHGTLHSFTTLHVPGHPGLAEDVPYTVVLVDLDEGIRVLADLIDCEPEAVRVGMAVDVVFTPWTEEWALPRFRPSPS